VPVALPKVNVGVTEGVGVGVGADDVLPKINGAAAAVEELVVEVAEVESVPPLPPLPLPPLPLLLPNTNGALLLEAAAAVVPVG